MQSSSSCSAITGYKLAAMQVCFTYGTMCRLVDATVPPQLGQAMLLSRLNLRNTSLRGNLTDYMFENLGVGAALCVTEQRCWLH